MKKGKWRLPTSDEIYYLLENYEVRTTIDSIVFKNKHGKFTNEFIQHNESVDNDKFNFYTVYWLENNMFWACNIYDGKYKIAKSLDINDVASVKLCREVHLK